MTTTAPERRRSGTPGRLRRSVGYAFAAAFDALLLLLVNVWPGWDVLPFLTADTTRVIGIVNASLVVALVFNLVRVLWAPKRLTAFAETVDAALAVAVAVRLLQVFPFDVADGGLWELAGRTLLVVVAVAASIGAVVNLVTLLRGPTDVPLDTDV